MKNFMPWFVLSVLGTTGFAIIVGYCLNIAYIVHGIGGPVTTTFILRIAGIFLTPLGAIMGFIS